ncbi:inner nuclear membrane protein enriched at telomere/subtelomere region [Marasmius tenuissimus]|uniref:Inner nuclear membrane protein enriched at telomere/subtelomere region n=1 Tax=Marasmius tenuissimus TaxID=585030 RepID=A0ABR3AD66_9AGAR
MSRLTAAQVISLGEYLEPDFEPSTLTISQLLGILGYHNIVYPTPYSKAKLVQVFNDEVKRKASRLKKDRIKKANSIASDEGITDGITGEPLNRRKAGSASHSRSTAVLILLEHRTQQRLGDRLDDFQRLRQTMKTPRLSDQTPYAATELYLPSYVKLIICASPNDDDPLLSRDLADPQGKLHALSSHLSQKKASPKNKNFLLEKLVEPRRRRTCPENRIAAFLWHGWEDNNIFQSGAESSSPVRPSPVRTKARRSSAAPRKSRKSMSAPPQASPPKDYHPPPLSPPQSKFAPDIPPFVTPASSRKSGRFSLVPTSPSPPKVASPVQVPPLKFEEEAVPEEEMPAHPLDTLDEANEEPGLDDANETREEAENQEDVEADENEEADIDQKQVIAIQKRIAEGGRPISPNAVGALLGDEVKPMPLIIRLIIYILVALSSYGVYQHKIESASIGYCNPGTSTNSRLEDLKSQRAAVEACNAENRTQLYADDPDSPPCPPLPILPFAHTCTPCPDHGVCSGHAVACEKPYILKSPFPLSFLLPPPTDPTNVNLSLQVSTWSQVRPEDMAWKIISEVTDGLPGFGSVGVVPTCVEDPRRKQHIGAIGRAIEKTLAAERGRRLCYLERERVVKETDGGEARRWGIPEDELRGRFRPNEDPKQLHYDDNFEDAVKELTQWGGVLLGEDSEGKRYLAHKSPMLTWDCQMRVKSREAWEEWRMTVFGTLGLATFILLSRSRRARRQLDNQRAAELVQVALDTLRHQEFAYHVDPVSVPQPYLSSVQLRDLVLQEEHNVKERKRVWEKVERVVEGNANVRANEEEVKGGDQMRVWRWVGATGLPTGTPNTPLRLQSGLQTEDAEES